MRSIKDYDYDLPLELIAQKPLPRREDSRLLVLPKNSQEFIHKHIRDLPDLISPDTLVVLNDAKVMPARLLGKKEGTGGKAETFVYRVSFDERNEPVCEAMFKVRGGFKPGLRIVFDDGVVAVCQTPTGEGKGTARFEGLPPEGFYEWLRKTGQTPLPPYIMRAPDEDDKSRYQTVYARSEGAVAAPTAGLHFTQEIIDAMRSRGVRFEFVTLHVSLGTFLPPNSDKIDEIRLHSEFCEVSQAAADAVNKAKREGRRILAVGTTAVRTLETAADKTGLLKAFRGDTDIFIHPPYEFKIVDALLTNFHLPQSTLLALVCALAGRERALSAYKIATEARYRFFSYGDAMLVDA